MSRAVFLRSAATESSRSRISPSGPDDGPLASLRSESAGTNRKERIACWSVSGIQCFLRSLVHQRLARALGDDLAALIEGSVCEFDDAGGGPRLAFAQAYDLGLYPKRVAVKDRLGETDVGHAEVGDGRAERGVVHPDADH